MNHQELQAAVEERARLQAQVAELDERIINFLTGKFTPAQVEQEDGGRIFQSDKHKAD